MNTHVEYLEEIESSVIVVAGEVALARKLATPRFEVIENTLEHILDVIQDLKRLEGIPIGLQRVKRE